jgi:protein subunit release factor A
VLAAEPGAWLLHVWLIADNSDGFVFLADIALMLRRLTERAGAGIKPADLPFDQHSVASLHFFAQLSPEAVPVLQRQVGVHRGQLVPADSQDGRVRTFLVAVELLRTGDTPSTVRPSGSVLRTYNYIHRRVTYHSTGEVLPLTRVLRGEVP